MTAHTNFKPATQALVDAATQHVKGYLEENAVDSSHDFWHIKRVCELSKRLASKMDSKLLQAQGCTVQLCALLHDLQDWKYSGSDKLGPEAVEKFLVEQKADDGLVEVVLFVTRSIGFKESLASASRPAPPCPEALAILEVVQDADRLDAIGASFPLFPAPQRCSSAMEPLHALDLDWLLPSHRKRHKTTCHSMRTATARCRGRRSRALLHVWRPLRSRAPRPGRGAARQPHQGRVHEQ